MSVADRSAPVGPGRGAPGASGPLSDEGDRQPSIGTCVQPADGSHASLVHGSPSSQLPQLAASGVALASAVDPSVAPSASSAPHAASALLHEESTAATDGTSARETNR